MIETDIKLSKSDLESETHIQKDQNNKEANNKVEVQGTKVLENLGDVSYPVKNPEKSKKNKESNLKLKPDFVNKPNIYNIFNIFNNQISIKEDENRLLSKKEEKIKRILMIIENNKLFSKFSSKIDKQCSNSIKRNQQDNINCSLNSKKEIIMKTLDDFIFNNNFTSCGFCFHKYFIPYQNISRKYSMNMKKYFKKIIEELIFDEYTHFCAIFKEHLIYDDHTEVLKKFYILKKSKANLETLLEFLDNFSKVFPNYFCLYEKKYVYKNIERKQKLINRTNENIDKKNKANSSQNQTNLFSINFIKNMEKLNSKNDLLNEEKRSQDKKKSINSDSIKNTYFINSNNIKNSQLQKGNVDQEKTKWLHKGMDLHELVKKFIMQDSKSSMNISQEKEISKQFSEKEKKPLKNKIKQNSKDNLNLIYTKTERKKSESNGVIRNLRNKIKQPFFSKKENKIINHHHNNNDNDNIKYEKIFKTSENPLNMLLFPKAENEILLTLDQPNYATKIGNKYRQKSSTKRSKNNQNPLTLIKAPLPLHFFQRQQSEKTLIPYQVMLKKKYFNGINDIQNLNYNNKRTSCVALSSEKNHSNIKVNANIRSISEMRSKTLKNIYQPRNCAKSLRKLTLNLKGISLNPSNRKMASRNFILEKKQSVPEIMNVQKFGLFRTKDQSPKIHIYSQKKNTRNVFTNKLRDPDCQTFRNSKSSNNIIKNEMRYILDNDLWGFHNSLPSHKNRNSIYKGTTQFQKKGSIQFSSKIPWNLINKIASSYNSNVKSRYKT